MKLSIRLLIAFLWIVPVFVAAQTEPVDLKVIELIKQEGFNNSKINETAIYLTDAIGPRLSGSSSLEKANFWAKNQLMEWGMSNVRIEPWGEFGRGWENEKFYIAMTAPYYQPLIAVPQAWSGSTNGLIRAKVAVVDIKSKEDIEKYRGKLKDLIVISPIQRELQISFDPAATRFTDEQLAGLKQLPEQTDRGRRNMGDFAAMRELGASINEFLKEEGVAAIINSSGTFGTVRSGGISRNTNRFSSPD
jgi:carboxypeptidase Q